MNTALKSNLTRLILLAAVGLLMVMPAAGQEDTDDAAENPLLDTLALVPADALISERPVLISYADYEQIAAARNMTRPTAADFLNRTENSALWIGATGGLSSGMQLNYFFTQIEEMEPLTGFSWMQIDRSLMFGDAPSIGLILGGEFDTDAIAAAYTARDYTSSSAAGDVTVWCSAGGCDDGMSVNFSNRNPADPFGGELGRSQPVAVMPDFVVSSPEFALVRQMVDAYSDTQPSLADNADVYAAAQAIAFTGGIRQAMFFTQAALGDPATGDGPLPPYSLAFLADTWQNDTQIALIGLVYDSAADANAAVVEVLARLETAVSTVTDSTFMELIEQRGGEVYDAYVYQVDDAGPFVTLLLLHQPMPDNSIQDLGGRSGYAPSSMVFRLLADGLFRRDIGWLAAD